MRVQALGVVGVCCLLALAGCGAIPGAQSTVDYPPGTSENGVTNATELFRTHDVQSLDDAYSMDVEYTERAGNRTSLEYRRYRVDPDAQAIAVETGVDNTTLRRRYYTNGTVHELDYNDGSKNYGTLDFDWSYTSAREELVRTRQLPRFVEAANYTLESVDESDDSTLIRYRLSWKEHVDENTKRGRLVVDTQGRIHLFQYHYVTEAYQTNYTVKWDYSESSLERPDWVPDATDTG